MPERIGWLPVMTTSMNDDGPSVSMTTLRLYRRPNHNDICGANVVGQIEGTGMGLASAQHIVQQHGGALTVESAEGVGTAVTLSVSLRDAGTA